MDLKLIRMQAGVKDNCDARAIQCLGRIVPYLDHVARLDEENFSIRVEVRPRYVPSELIGACQLLI